LLYEAMKKVFWTPGQYRPGPPKAQRLEMIFLLWNWFAYSNQDSGDLSRHRKHTTLYEDLCM